MGARNGKAYIDGLRDGRHVYVNGELVRDVTTFAPFQGGLRTLSELYDRQSDPRYAAQLTMPSPTSGEPVSTSFAIAKTWEDMQRRLAGERLRCELTYGLMGRLPDFMNAYVTDLASCSSLWGKTKPELGENGRRYHETCREKDLCLTHVLVDPSIDRSKGLEAQEALRVVKETDAGLVVRGARMLSTLAPLADEILVGPNVPRKPGQEAYAICFAIPVASSGLKLVCREAYDAGRGVFDQPLTSRFDEGDALAIFDDVLVPWERVFSRGDDLAQYDSLMAGFPGYLWLQAAIRSTVKLKFLVGVAYLAARAVGRNESARYQEMLGELVAYVELAEGIVNATAMETLFNANVPLDGSASKTSDAADSSHGIDLAIGSRFKVKRRGGVGIASLRHFFPTVLTKVIDTMRLVGSSSLIMTPTEEDFAHPDLQELLPRHMRGKDITAAERVRVMRLAWDLLGTQFGSRQFMYEWFYAGDPILNRTLYFGGERGKECVALAEDLVRSLQATTK
jgi:aromatic ring hydroxylase